MNGSGLIEEADHSPFSAEWHTIEILLREAEKVLIASCNGRAIIKKPTEPGLQPKFI